MKLLAGNSNKPLAHAISDHLKVPLIDVEYKPFPDLEIFLEIQENVRGSDVFVIQSTSTPVNDSLMELLLTIDALKRGSANSITAVIPYYGYARQDRKTAPRTPISAKLVADLIQTAGVSRVLSFEFHSSPIQGFFDVPVDNLFASPLFASDIQGRYDLSNTVIVSPDVGGLSRARAIAKRLSLDVAVIDKRRTGVGQVDVMNVIGHIHGKDCILVDDIIDSGGTLIKAAEALKSQGAQSISAYCVHGVLSGDALNRLDGSLIQDMCFTDSIHLKEQVLSHPRVRQLTIAPLIGEAIQRISHNESVSSLFA